MFRSRVATRDGGGMGHTRDSGTAATEARAASRRPAREMWLLAAIVVGAVALRIGWIWHANVNPFDGRNDDTVFYYATARSIAAHLDYRDQYGRLTAAWPPGYSLTLAPVLKVLGAGLWQAKALNVALSAATVVLTYALGRRVFGAGAGLTAAAILAAFPGDIFFSTLIMTEVLFGFVFLLSIYLLLAWTLGEAEARAWQLLALGLLLGYATLIKSEAVFLAPAVVVLWKFALPGWRRTLRYGAVLAVGFVLALAPWTARNYARFDGFVPLRLNAGDYLSIAFERNYQSRADRFVVRALPYSETVGYMARHPWEIVPLQVDKLWYFVHDDADGARWAQNDVPTLPRTEAKAWGGVATLYWWAVLVVVAASVRTWWPGRDRARLAVVFAVVAWTGIEIISWPFTRYHFALLPIVSVLAGA
ncbi:MAG TPA: glycosyltransferase family 39 protein, partial [Dehalococcoidia bacterium]|nr:glycosyltransferase family 39 protein [Dehalococcoidia bacterium]